MIFVHGCGQRARTYANNQKQNPCPKYDGFDLLNSCARFDTVGNGPPDH
jgi:hypothetical protein